jgi:hypothetical protein
MELTELSCPSRVDILWPVAGSQIPKTASKLPEIKK